MRYLASDIDAEDAEGASAFLRHKTIIWGLVIGFAVTAGVGVGLWETFKYRFIPKRFGEVVAGQVYRSGQISKWQFEPTIRTHGIATVIDLNGVEPSDEHQAAEIASYETLGLNHYRFPLRGDGTGAVEVYINAIAKLAECHRNGEVTLVHCSAGAQRTGSVVAAFRVLVLGDSPQVAYQGMIKYGWNPREDQVMLQYLNGNMQHVAEVLASRGIIARVPHPLPLVGP